MRPTFSFLLLAAAVAACNDAGSESKGSGGPAGGAPPGIPVEVAVAQTDTVVDAIAATGQIEAMQSIELRPELDGRITQIHVREGARVRQGQPLFQIDASELRAQVARAEAERDLARQNLARTRDLLEQRASSQAELERAEATSRSAEATLQLLQVQLRRSTVRAPFTGVAGERTVSLGDYVTTASRLISLQTVNPQRATFTVPERYAASLQVGQQVAFRVAALPGREFTGTVDFVDPVVRMPGRTITIKAVVPNATRELQSGMFIEARLATEVRPGAVIIPEDAILPLQGANYVWAVVDGKASRREVDLGVRTPGFVEARTGVAVGEQVVVGGLERLQEGAPVAPRVVERRPGVVPGESGMDSPDSAAGDSAAAPSQAVPATSDSASGE
ncbi:MAG TPA: efflux RND transporter periplasmic adaptor subunit [Gemmatimonadales bacterium]|nr:efflux RND transporter periplasmic adaptor subunit [Gemmatimonadales bacterium]